jgi:hypothetical protein
MHRLLARTALAVTFIVAAASGCDGGGGGDLDPDVVTNLPPGDGTGTALTGTYSMESVTTSCDGDCSTTVDEFTYSACDVGTRLDSTAEVIQADGALMIDVEDSDYVSQLAGGVDADGSFDVGGLRTQQGGEVTITARGVGTITAGTMTGTTRLRVDGMGLGCTIGVDVDGTRD